LVTGINLLGAKKNSALGFSLFVFIPLTAWSFIRSAAGYVSLRRRNCPTNNGIFQRPEDQINKPSSLFLLFLFLFFVSSFNLTFNDE
jgi:hypothetical protein